MLHGSPPIAVDPTQFRRSVSRFATGITIDDPSMPTNDNGIDNRMRPPWRAGDSPPAVLQCCAPSFPGGFRILQVVTRRVMRETTPKHDRDIVALETKRSPPSGGA